MHVAQRVILIVDGRPDRRAACRAALEARGYTVVEAADAESGLRLASVVKLDLVLAEIGHAEDANLAFVRALRGDERTGDVEIVALTATSNGTAATALQAGCVRCLDGEPAPASLLRVVEELIGAPPHA